MTTTRTIPPDPGSIVPTDTEGGLVFAVRLPGGEDQFGDGRLGWGDLDAGPGSTAATWIHLDRTRERAQQWLRDQSAVDPVIAEGMLDEETRPRIQEVDDGLLVILRGVNMNPGAEPDDLISVRIWVEPTRVITLRHLRFQTIAELRAAAQVGRAPATPGGLLARLASGLASRLSPSVDNLVGLLDEIEAAMLENDDDAPSARSSLADIRRQSITLRRHLVPQRQAMQQLAQLEHPVLTGHDRTQLRAAAEQVARSVDALEEIRDRAAVTQDELRARHEARVGRTVYLLTLVATIALPLGLITGILGMNVGGMPMAESSLGFGIVCGLMVLIAAAEVWIFRRLRIL